MPSPVRNPSVPGASTGLHTTTGRCTPCALNAWRAQSSRCSPSPCSPPAAGNDGGGSGSGGGTANRAGAAVSADRVEPLATVPEPRLPVTVDSADGTKVTVTSADRLVPLTGSLNEIVFTLGLGEHVVARDITATFEQAERLPVVTRAHDVSAESVLSLRPTLVVAETTTGPAEAVDQIRDAGIPLLVVEPAKSLDDVGKRITTVAHALGVDAAGEELSSRTAERIAAVQKRIPAPADGAKPRVAFLYLRGSASVYLLGGRDSGASSLLEAAGAVDAGRSPASTRTSPRSPARHWRRPRPTRSS